MIQNFKNRFSFVSNLLTTVSVLGFKVLRTGSKLGCSLKKKGLHLDFISNFSIFLPKLECSIKKKKGLHFDFISNFSIFLPKLGCSLKKKKKKSSLRIVLYTLNTHLQQIETVTLNTEILKYIDYVKLKPGSLNVLKFQERVRANLCEPPESHHCFTL